MFSCAHWFFSIFYVMKYWCKCFAHFNGLSSDYSVVGDVDTVWLNPLLNTYNFLFCDFPTVISFIAFMALKSLFAYPKVTKIMFLV